MMIPFGVDPRVMRQNLSGNRRECKDQRLQYFEIPGNPGSLCFTRVLARISTRPDEVNFAFEAAAGNLGFRTLPNTERFPFRVLPRECSIFSYEITNEYYTKCVLGWILIFYFSIFFTTLPKVVPTNGENKFVQK